MRRRDFEAMVRRMTAELPAEFLEGVERVEVTSKTLPHPLREGVYTLGECTPLEFGADGHGGEIRSMVELHYGSFAALAKDAPDFDWRAEAWETLTHEVRHHLEWRARVPDLERLDDAAEANYARHEGEPFAPLFHLDGERVGENVTRIDDDLFFDFAQTARAHEQAAGATWRFVWHGRSWSVDLPATLPDALFLVVEGLRPEPEGDVVLVIRRKPGARDVLRRASVVQIKAPARAVTS